MAQASGVAGSQPEDKPADKSNDSKSESKKADVASANLLSIFDRMVGGAKGRGSAKRG